MAVKTFHFMICHMVLVEEFRGKFRFQYLTFVVALKAGKFRDVSVTRDDIRVASFTLDASVDIDPVVENESVVDLDIAARLEMTCSAFREVVLLALLFVEMTDETLDVRDDHMSTLYDLRVTCGATQLFLSSHLFNVARVAEEHILEDHLVLEVCPAVATFLQTTGIVDFSVGPRRASARNEVNKRKLPILPFPLQMIDEARLVVTFNTIHVAMTRGLPRIYKHLHVVTQTAKEGRFRYLVESNYNNNKAKECKRKENGNPLLVLDGSPL
jgi:hypothetical protein